MADDLKPGWLARDVRRACGWDPRYRRLSEGETIEVGDEVMTDVKLGWRPAGDTVGQRAPDPAYTSHRIYRRLIIAAPRRWRHKKRGSTYTEVGRGALQISGTLAAHESADLDKQIEASIIDGLDMTPIVIYRADEDGSWWARPVSQFEDGRFEEIV